MAATVPVRRKKRPKCAMCRASVKVTPGKLVASWCSDACRKRAKRIVAAATGNPSGHEPMSGVETGIPAGQTGVSGREAGPLGKETTEFPGSSTAAVREARARSRAARRYAARRTLWRITGERTCRGCGRTVMDPETGVIKAQSAEGHTVVLGTLKCAKIWFCPPCSATIHTRRAAQITGAVVSWIRAGGSAYLVTFTPATPTRTAWTR
ncbi:hypothetical protein [Kitasatospora cheerisanensis]|nr:hypothetical protein [Kitasatospora cheerisanensis]